MLCDAFLAANFAGGTPCGRPEDIQVHPRSQHVFIAMTDGIAGSDGYPDSRIFQVGKYTAGIAAKQPPGGLYRIVEDSADGPGLPKPATSGSGARPAARPGATTTIERAGAPRSGISPLPAGFVAQPLGHRGASPPAYALSGGFGRGSPARVLHGENVDVGSAFFNRLEQHGDVPAFPL